MIEFINYTLSYCTDKSESWKSWIDLQKRNFFSITLCLLLTGLKKWRNVLK